MTAPKYAEADARLQQARKPDWVDERFLVRPARFEVDAPAAWTIP
ncbi:hypothetical protein [Rhodococcus ruber]